METTSNSISNFKRPHVNESTTAGSNRGTEREYEIQGGDKTLSRSSRGTKIVGEQRLQLVDRSEILNNKKKRVLIRLSYAGKKNKNR